MIGGTDAVLFMMMKGKEATQPKWHKGSRLSS